MKYLLGFLLFTASAFAEPRPMTITIFEDPDFGRSVEVTAAQLAGETLTFKFSDTVAGPWQTVAVWAPSTEDQTVAIAFNTPGYDKVFVSAFGEMTPALAVEKSYFIKPVFKMWVAKNK